MYSYLCSQLQTNRVRVVGCFVHTLLSHWYTSDLALVKLVTELDQVTALPIDDNVDIAACIWSSSHIVLALNALCAICCWKYFCLYALPRARGLSNVHKNDLFLVSKISTKYLQGSPLEPWRYYRRNVWSRVAESDIVRGGKDPIDLDLNEVVSPCSWCCSCRDPRIILPGNRIPFAAANMNFNCSIFEKILPVK